MWGLPLEMFKLYELQRARYLDNGTLTKSRHRWHVDIEICRDTDEQANLLRTAIIRLDYFPIVKTDKTRLVDYFTLVYLFVGVWWRGDFAWWRVGWWRGGELVASWLVAKLPGGEMTGNRSIVALFLIHQCTYFLRTVCLHMVSFVTTEITKINQPYK